MRPLSPRRPITGRLGTRQPWQHAFSYIHWHCQHSMRSRVYATVMRLSVCLFVPSGSKPTWRLVDIDWLLHGWHTAGMQTVPHRRLNADLFIDLLLSQVTYSLGCITMQSIRCCLLLQIFYWSVCVSASHSLALCQHGWTDWDAFWAIDSGGSREPCIIWGAEMPREVLLSVGLA